MPRNPRRLVALDQGKQYRIGPLTFDREGAGATSYTMDWSYFGFAASMRPSMFLRLAFRKDDLTTDRQTARMAQGVSEGIAFAPLYLMVNAPGDRHPHYRVTGHEGRHRANQILALVGDDPVPVVMQVRYVRARDLTPETIATINRGLVSQDGDYVHGPIFAGEAIYYADGYSDQRVVKLPDHVEPYVSEEDELADLLFARNPARVQEQPAIVYVYGEGAFWKFQRPQLRLIEQGEPWYEAGRILRTPAFNYRTGRWSNLPDGVDQSGPYGRPYAWKNHVEVVGMDEANDFFADFLGE